MLSIIALEDQQQYTNYDTLCKVRLYLNSIIKSDFLMSLEVSLLGLAYTLQLSVPLQSKRQNLFKTLPGIPNGYSKNIGRALRKCKQLFKTNILKYYGICKKSLC